MDNNVELNREVQEVKTKLDLVLEEIRDLKKSYVTQAVYNTLVDRVKNLENNPWKIINIAIAVAAVLVAYYK